jgi:hypothetical protein
MPLLLPQFRGTWSQQVLTQNVHIKSHENQQSLFIFNTSYLVLFQTACFIYELRKFSVFFKISANQISTIEIHACLQQPLALFDITSVTPKRCISMNI